MTQRIAFHDKLLAALDEPGCGFCRLLAESSDRLVEAILNEMVNDVPLREELNAARGYCRRHAALFVRTGGALGSTTMMQGVLKTLIRILDSSQIDQATASRLGNLRRSLDSSASSAHPAAVALANSLAPQTPCPVCAKENELLGHLTSAFLNHLQSNSELEVVYRQSDGLCLPHFRHVVGRAVPGPELTILVGAQREIWARLEADLEEFLRKSDHRFSHETMGLERDAWQRALAAVSGALDNGNR